VARYLMNVVNARRKKGEKYTDLNKSPWMKQTRHGSAQGQAFQRERRAGTPSQVDGRRYREDCDEDARAAEIQAAGMLTRRLVREQLAGRSTRMMQRHEAALAL
jgi:hypothetical protein